MVPGQKPDLEAQVRADEIVSAWDRYIADIGAAREGSSYVAVESDTRATIERLYDLEDRIARTRARTRAGLLAKARMASEDPAFDGIEDQIEKALEERFSTGQFMGLSVVLDLLRLQGGDA